MGCSKSLQYSVRQEELLVLWEDHFWESRTVFQCWLSQTSFVVLNRTQLLWVFIFLAGKFCISLNICLDSFTNYHTVNMQLSKKGKNKSSGHMESSSQNVLGDYGQFSWYKCFIKQKQCSIGYTGSGVGPYMQALSIAACDLGQIP